MRLIGRASGRRETGVSAVQIDLITAGGLEVPIGPDAESSDVDWARDAADATQQPGLGLQGGSGYGRRRSAGDVCECLCRQQEGLDA